jgi:hypothetical protein
MADTVALAMVAAEEFTAVVAFSMAPYLMAAAALSTGRISARCVRGGA